MNARDRVIGLLDEAGIAVGGGHPWDITVRDERFFARILGHGSLGLGESYMAGWWDAPDLVQCIARMIASDLESRVRTSPAIIRDSLLARLFNRQTIAQTRKLARLHYNLSNRMFATMLGPTMAYSCAYWRGANDLDGAQRAKLDLICRKLALGPEDRVLDIGCGWGSFAKFAAQTRGCRVTAITVAGEQAAQARAFCAGLPVEVIHCDYRDFDRYATPGGFTKAVSVGMIEHVGYRHYRDFMGYAARVLRDNGLFLLHSIGSHKSVTTTDAWIDKYVFPGGVLPSIKQLATAVEGLFAIEDLHAFGQDYGPTLKAWLANFDRYWRDCGTRPPVGFKGAGPIFYRMWKFYLLSSAATFAARATTVWQMVLAKDGARGDYLPQR